MTVEFDDEIRISLAYVKLQCYLSGMDIPFSDCEYVEYMEWQDIQMTSMKIGNEKWKDSFQDICNFTNDMWDYRLYANRGFIVTTYTGFDANNFASLQKWIVDDCIGAATICDNDDECFFAIFENEDDAIQFALRWS